MPEIPGTAPGAGSPLLTLTADLMGEVLLFLPLPSRFLLKATARGLATVVAAHLATVTEVRTSDVRSPRGFLTHLANDWPRSLTRLCSLQLRGLDHVRDVTCFRLGQSLPPTLTSLDLSLCPHVTNRGIHSLLAGTVILSLKHFDITLTDTDYSVVLLLYERCPGIVVRRLPKWLVGHFHCPWGEVHTYYADGSFEFTRSSESRGFVWSLQSQGSEVTDCLQYVNVNILPPAAYRPGVRLRPFAPNLVLVGQAYWMMDPPDAFPADAEGTFASLPPGESVPIQTDEGRMLVSKMRVTPLKEEELRPPTALLAQIQDYVEVFQGTSHLFPVQDFAHETAASTI